MSEKDDDRTSEKGPKTAPEEEEDGISEEEEAPAAEAADSDDDHDLDVGQALVSTLNTRPLRAYRPLWKALVES
ncbi:MAG: hypothetical protein LQ344_006226 [Seirophora lacunosa]|nr:MAG: hypothetical protein LQ344_006226 [Seirophora lacunosa]